MGFVIVSRRENTMMKISEWITEDAVRTAESRMILKHVNALMQKKSIPESEALRILEIDAQRYEAAKMVGLS